MTENKRYTTDNGSNEDVCLVDNVTGKEFESDFDEIVDLLNDKEHTINEMAKTIRIYDDGYIDLNKKYKKVVDENEQLKQSYQVLADMCDEYLSSKYLLENENESLKKENKQLTEEKEFWKGDSCKCSNYLSILSMDCQIVQEAICDLKNVIDVDTEASKLLDKLDDKFDELNQHRIKMYSR